MFKNKFPFLFYLIYILFFSCVFAEQVKVTRKEASRKDLRIDEKCCSIDEYVEIDENGRLECHQKRISKKHKPKTEENTLNPTEVDHAGIPDCDYRVLSNQNYQWFRYTTSKVEVGLVYLFYDVWMEVTDNNYCIDTFADKYVSLNRNTSTLDERKTKLIAFCGLKDMRNFYTHVGVNLFFLMASALLNAATIFIYVVVRKINHSRDWLQFTIFIAEFCAHVSYALLIAIDTYVLLWKDSLKHVTFSVYYFTYYMYTVKFTLVIATSVDLFLCVWRPYSGMDQSNRTKRNIRAVIMCYTLPALAPVLTNLWTYIMQEENVYMNSNARLLDGVPNSYKIFNQGIYIVQFGINSVIATITAILIHRQRKKAKLLDDKKVQMRIQDIQKSFVVYIKLICATEIPFFVCFILLHSQILGPAMSIWNTSARGMYLVSAVYVFIVFGCSKSHKQYIRKMYENSSTW